tara:strand:- start:176 stop:349 length:174 start_codon:yes stop_codon:yes gene_type:complete
MQSLFMKEQDQINKIDQSTEKALKQIEKERKNNKRDYILEWFRYVELTQKFLKNKLN